MRNEKTNPILSSAIPLLKEYSQATGTYINILDQNLMPIHELLNVNYKDKNICYFCAKQRNHESKTRLPRTRRDISRHSGGEPQLPSACSRMHCAALKESECLGGLHTYSCPFGMTLWISPIYLNESFLGALLGGMAADETERNITSLAELMLLCAQSISIGSDGCHKTVERHSLQREELFALIEELKAHPPDGNTKAEYPVDTELKMLDALRAGDIETVKRSLNEILAFVLHTHRDDFNHVKSRGIELAFLLSRVGLNSFFTIKTMLKNDRRNFLLIEKTNNPEELIDVLYRITDDLEELQQSFNKTHHASALKKAEDYILENFSRKLCLKGIAKASGFSGPYFSKIFKDAMGENLTSYLNRLRVEKATSLLINTGLSLSSIAQVCGFVDQSWFSKTFKHYRGKSPGKFRSQCGKPARMSASE